MSTKPGAADQGTSCLVQAECGDKPYTNEGDSSKLHCKVEHLWLAERYKCRLNGVVLVLYAADVFPIASFPLLYMFVLAGMFR